MKKIALLLAAFALFACGCDVTVVDRRHEPRPEVNPPDVVVREEIRVVFIVGTRISYVPDTDEDIFLCDKRWYWHRGGVWYVADSYNGRRAVITVIPRAFYAIPHTHVKYRVIAPPPVVFRGRPRMAAIEDTGVEYARDVDTDIFFYGEFWYRQHAGAWFRAAAYSGPWIYISAPPAALYKIPPGHAKGRVAHIPDVEFKSPPKKTPIRGTDVYYVADSDEDIFFCEGAWYRFHGGCWFKSSSHAGPWAYIKAPPAAFGKIPPGHEKHHVVSEKEWKERNEKAEREKAQREKEEGEKAEREWKQREKEAKEKSEAARQQKEKEDREKREKAEDARQQKEKEDKEKREKAEQERRKKEKEQEEKEKKDKGVRLEKAPDVTVPPLATPKQTPAEPKVVEKTPRPMPDPRPAPLPEPRQTPQPTTRQTPQPPEASKQELNDKDKSKDNQPRGKEQETKDKGKEDKDASSEKPTETVVDKVKVTLIAGTRVWFVGDTDEDVFYCDKKWYWCKGGAWSVADAYKGKKAALAAIPQALYAIPRDHAKHRVLETGKDAPEPEKRSEGKKK